MKKILATILFLSAMALVWAQTSTFNAWFSWTPNPAIELVSGYRIEYMRFPGANPGTNTWQYSHSVPYTTNVTVVRNLTRGFTYRFRVFAVNSIGTGTNLSNVIQIPTNAPSAVTNYDLTTPR
jgi:hypothetical protein